MSSGLDRDTTDKFYTSDQVVNLCINTFLEEVKVSDDDLLLEPSAGNGAWMRLAGIGRCLFLDLYPEHPAILKQDYLSFQPDDCSTIHVIGNPPFGRQSSLAIKFIRKSTEFASTISFILPRSFKKQSFQSKFPLNFHLLREIDLPDDAFLLQGQAYHVPCVFQIWERRNYKRVVEEKQEPIGYHFVKKEENPHISFRRVGVYAGTVSTETENKSQQSHYFLRFDNESDIKKVMDIEFTTRDHTVGPRSISKGELIEAFNQKMKR